MTTENQLVGAPKDNAPNSVEELLGSLPGGVDVQVLGSSPQGELVQLGGGNGLPEGLNIEDLIAQLGGGAPRQQEAPAELGDLPEGHKTLPQLLEEGPTQEEALEKAVAQLDEMKESLKVFPAEMRGKPSDKYLFGVGVYHMCPAHGPELTPEGELLAKYEDDRVFAKTGDDLYKEVRKLFGSLTNQQGRVNHYQLCRDIVHVALRSGVTEIVNEPGSETAIIAKAGPNHDGFFTYLANAENSSQRNADALQDIIRDVFGYINKVSEQKGKRPDFSKSSPPTQGS